jgi:hypothetical protein
MRVLFGLLMLASTIGSAGAQPIYVWHEFHVTEPGGFFSKTLKEMGSREFQVLVTAGCAAFGVNCAQQAAQIRRASEILSAAYTSIGGTHYISGRLTWQQGEEWKGVFDAFQGYQVCRAAVDWGNASITGESTFNTVVDNSQGGLTFYAVVPKNRSSGRNWVNANFLIEYVPIGTGAQYSCAAEGEIQWACKGPNGCSVLNRLR